MKNFGKLSAALTAVVLGLIQTAVADTQLATPDELKSEVGADAEVLTRGPLHEAFATPTTHEPIEFPIVKKQPPKAIDELIPEHKPAGDNVMWLPGYWAFDDERDDFMWISGLWRNAPPGRQWVPGYWKDVEQGHRWNPGMWAAAGSNVAYQPKPPKSQERGASSRRPSANHFYVPGNWVYQNNDYKWRPGYWAPQQQDWVWVPARYTRAGDRYTFTDGYWDHELSARGQAFAPVRFRNGAHTRAGFRYRPASVLSADAQLLTHLFVRPQTGQFAFGDYYDNRYRSAYRPWFEHFSSDGGYDPLLSHYDWTSGGNFLQNLRSWNKYFVDNPKFRPRHTLAEQLAFATNNAGFEHLDRVVLGNTLSKVVSTGSAAGNFVQVTDNVSRDVLGVTNQIRGLTGQRLKLETGAAANATVNQTLALPKLPGVQTPQATRNLVPDNPLNLRNVAPRAPVRRGGGVRSKLPVGVPGLPF